MRQIARPAYAPMDVFDICVNHISPGEQQTKFVDIADTVRTASILYLQRAQVWQLHEFEPFPHRDLDSVVTGNVTKRDFKSLYENHFVKGDARNIYEAILASATGKLCPQCGFGHTRNLDHYLPKAKYPLFSVLPINLVPTCRDCNTDKAATITRTAGGQTIHPYFDAPHFFQEQWIFAQVEETRPPTVVFSASAPDHWDETSKLRVQAHFDGFNLSERFSVQVATELAATSDYLSNLETVEARRNHLADKARSYARIHSNSWQTALTQALAASDWYCREGFAP